MAHKNMSKFIATHVDIRAPHHIAIIKSMSIGISSRAEIHVLIECQGHPDKSVNKDENSKTMLTSRRERYEAIGSGAKYIYASLSPSYN